MIVHCSLWKFKDGTSTATVGQIAEHWRALKEGIPVIRHMLVGPDLGNWPENYDLAALIYFDNADGYESYRSDALHLDFAHTWLVPNVEDLHRRVAVQFELPAGVVP